jgi:hypothetical protein
LKYISIFRALKNAMIMTKIFHSFFLLLAILISFSSTAQLAGSGNTYDFNSNYLTIPDAPNLNPTEVSIEAWIKADSWSNNYWENVIVSKDGWQNGDAGYTLRAGANGTLSFNASINGAWAEVVSLSGAMQTGVWYHVAGTYDGTTMKAYINGEEIGATSITGTITQDYYDVYIGRVAYTAGGTRYFDGMIDEVRIWEGAIPESSIQEYMCKKVTVGHPEYVSLIGYWKLDDVGAITDSSPNGNNGVSVGATQVTSGAPIGDESEFNYGGGTIDMTLDWMLTDSVQVTSASNLNTMHLYRVDATPNTLAESGGMASWNSTHYYGVFIGATAPVSYDLTYHYGATAMTVGNEAYVDLAGRVIPNGSPWTNQSATTDEILNTTTKTLSTNAEVMLALYCTKINLNTSGVINVCSDGTVDLMDQATNTNYQWNNASGEILGATSADYTALATGDYYLVANDGFCIDTSETAVISIFSDPTVEFGTLASSFCEDEEDQTILDGAPVGGMYLGSSIVLDVFSPSTAGVGPLTLYYNYTDGNGCSGIDSLELTVSAVPTISSINHVGDTLCVSDSGLGNTYVWILDGVEVGSGVDTCYTVLANGNYQVVVENMNGCSSDTSEILIDNVGDEEFLLNVEMNVSPNPVQDQLKVQITEGLEDATITLTEIS